MSRGKSVLLYFRSTEVQRSIEVRLVPLNGIDRFSMLEKIVLYYLKEAKDHSC
jgi:hypothetical protein